MFEIIKKWQQALKLTKSDIEGYDYKCLNSSEDGMEIISANENVIYLSPKDYCYITSDDAVATLKAFGGECSNALLVNNTVILI